MADTPFGRLDEGFPNGVAGKSPVDLAARLHVGLYTFLDVPLDIHHILAGPDISQASINIG